jgi:hypothetical protein
MDQYLKLILSAGSSRTFNCCAISNAIVAASPPPEAPKPGVKPPPGPTLMFESRALNYCIVIKEPGRTQPGMFAPPPGKTLRTRLYFPYNREKPHEGGVSIDTQNPKLDEALLETAGLDKKNRPEGYEHDKKLLRVLIDLPSLDPFLLKDRFRQGSVEVRDEYLYVQPEEWEAIRQFVHDQFRIVASVIFPGDTAQMDERVNQLTQQLWDLRDLTHLEALTKVFGLDPARTEEIFYSWKGVIYYDYEYNRLRGKITEVFDWFDQGSTPKDFIKPAMEKDLDRLRTQIKNHILSAKSETKRHLAKYHNGFDLFFREKKTASDFVAFLQSAPGNFYTLGESISKLSHSIVIWDRGTQNFRGRQLPAEQLMELFEFIAEVY